MIYLLRTRDRVEHWMAFHGPDSYFSLCDLDQELRNRLKHNPKKESGETLEVYDKVRSLLHEIMEDHGIDFNHVD